VKIANDRSRCVLRLVTGRAKVGMLVRLRDSDPSIPVSCLRQDRALILVDRVAAEQLGTSENLEVQNERYHPCCVEFVPTDD
jgi:hypothetical protein